MLVALVFVVAFVALMLAVFVRPNTGGIDTIFGHPLFSVASGSMTPAIDTGDLIVDSPVSTGQAAALRTGQIISFQASQQGAETIIITHRIVAVVDSGGTVQYRTRGDANNAPDEDLVAQNQIVGVYSGRVPLGGYVLSTLHQPLTFVILVMILVIHLVGGEVRRRWLLYGEQDRQARERRRLLDETAASPEMVGSPALASSGRSGKGGGKTID